MTLEHCTEGHLIADIVAQSGFPAAVGPTLTNASKIELVNKTFETPGILARAGVQVSIITDAPVIPQQFLPLCAGQAVKAGMDPFAALQAITITLPSTWAWLTGWVPWRWERTPTWWSATATPWSATPTCALCSSTDSGWWAEIPGK